MEEALKCSALSAVVGEISEFDFTTSRRFQLAVEQSQVTGFMIRNNCRKPNTTACLSRWRVTPLKSSPAITNNGDELPGLGFPKWNVELLKVKNGRPGSWIIGWSGGRFNVDDVNHFIPQWQHRKTG